MPISCSLLTLPNVTYFEALDNHEADYSLKLSMLPQYALSTKVGDLLHRFPLHRYPTVELLSLQYQPEFIPVVPHRFWLTLRVYQVVVR